MAREFIRSAEGELTTGRMLQEPPSIAELLDQKVVALDTECTGLDWLRRDRVFGVALAWGQPGQFKSWYGDVRYEATHRFVTDVVKALPRVTGWFFKFDVHIMRESGMPLREDAPDCALIRETLLDENQYDYSLERVSWDRIGRGKEEIWPELARIFGGKSTKEGQALNLARAPAELVAKYAKVDVLNTLEIWWQQEKEIEEQNLQRVAKLERRLMAAVVDMERGGVRVDCDRAARAIPELDARIDTAQRELDSIAGRPINVNSQPQVKELLKVHQEADGRWFTGDGVVLEPTESGKSGQLKTEKLYQCKMPGAALVAQIRGMIKARDVFLRKYICEMNYKGRVHATINQTRSETGDGTYTGRFSITDPALQQIHKRNKAMAAIVRACFLPDEDTEWACYDWSQKDFRIFAHYVNDRSINERYARDPNTDFHRATSEITGLPRDRDEKTGGANAKQMNLGLVFGMSAGRMAKEMNLPYTKNEKGFLVAGPEAQRLFAMYHDNIPGVNRLKASVSSVATSRGYILTQLGRRIRFPHKSEAYKAAGILFQSQAAESMKVKTVEIAEMLKECGGAARLMLLVHDEFDLSVRPGNPNLVRDIQTRLETFDGTGEFPLKYRIPIKSDVGFGKDWWEASK